MSVVDPPRPGSALTDPLRVLAVSAHLGDAMFSAGATLATLSAHGHSVTHVTAFAASVAESGDRRVEDMQAAAALGLQRIVHLPFPEAERRGYDDPAGPVRADDDAAADLRAALDALGEFDLVLAPFALGDHVDARQVRRALGMPGGRDDPEPEARFARGGVALWRDAPQILLGGDPPTPGDDAVVVSSDALGRKLAACACYATTIVPRLGGEERVRRMLLDLALTEGNRHGRPAPAETFVPAAPVVKALRRPVQARPRAV